MTDDTAAAKNPFKGLHYYTEEDRLLFFGRDREIEEFIRLVARDILSVLFARSGLGKTSRLRAGVIPRLREQNFLPVIVRMDYAQSAPRPAAQVLSGILAAAAAAKVELEATEATGALGDPREWRGTPWEFFHCYQFWNLRNDPVRPVLILDQFEELFTLGQSTPHRSEFLTQLADLAENRMPRSVRTALDQSGDRLKYDTRTQNFKLILALREDYVAKLDSLRPEMPAVMRNRYPLAPLDRERALEIVQKAGGPWVSEAVAKAIVAAVAGDSDSPEPEAPPEAAAGEIEPAYLSVMCDELFRRMAALDQTEIDLGLVRAERGNILDALYERSFDGLAPGTRVFVEDRLLTVGGFRASLPVAEARRDAVASSDLDRLVNCRLLRFEDRLGTTHVELSHDLLTPIVRKRRDARWAAAKAEAQRVAERAREAAFTAKLHRERLRLWTAAATVALLAGGIGFYVWGWVAPYQTYCRDFSKRWGTVHPVGPLSAAAVGHRQTTIRLTRNGWFGQVRTLEIIDANHRPASNASITTYLTDSDAAPDPRGSPSRYEYVLDRAGRVVYEVAYDRFGRMAWGLVYAPRGKADQGRRRSAKATFIGPDGLPQPQGHGRAEYVLFRYDPLGFEAELRYMDRAGNPMPGPDDAYGQRRTFDEHGREVRRTSVDKDGEPTNDAAGNAGLEADYDDDGNITERRAFDRKGEPTLVRGGYYHVTQKHDKWGRITEQRYFNLSNEPVEEAGQSGAHRIAWTYDSRGNPTRITLYDKSGGPMVAGGEIWDFAAHEQRSTFDAHNRVERIAYFGTQHEPLTGPEGWHSYGIEYDHNGFGAATSTFDAQGNPVNQQTSGTHRWERVNDARGRPLTERFYGADGQPVASRDGGYHLRRNRYDRAGNLIGQSHFDVAMKPVAVLDEGIYRSETRYDRFRNPTVTWYLDTAGRPMNSQQGVHKIVYSYDDYGSEVERRWYDKEEQPVPGPDGVQVVRKTYDERGLLKRIANYDAENQAVTDRQGIHETLFTFNDKRQQTLWQVFGLKRKPVENGAGDHLVITQFDARGRETLVTKLRADGRPNWDRELGIATRRQRYDQEGKWTEQAYYDAGDHLVDGPFGFAKGCYEPDADGRVMLVNYGAADRPAFNPLLGFAIKKTDRRKRGDTVDSYHDDAGALIEGPEGYAQVRRRWGDFGRLLTEAYFGIDGTPVAGPQGYHRVERTPDGQVRHFDTKGRELGTLGHPDFESVIVLSEITNVKMPAMKAGIQAGDILWRYGDWSYPVALAAERTGGTKPDAQLRALVQSFFAERDRLRDGPAPMTVIRRGHPVQLTVPPLPDKALGARLTDRLVPIATFEGWSLADAGVRADSVPAATR